MSETLEGYAEEVHPHHVTGWATGPAGAAPLQVTLRASGALLARTTPSFARPDVAALKPLSPICGFYLAYAGIGALLEQGAACLAIETEHHQAPLPLVDAAFKSAPAQHATPQYQTFDQTAGASPSPLKLAALRLDLLDHPAPARILDIGCNEGFFCHALAQRYPAATVLGVDHSAEFIARARARFPAPDFPAITFLAQSWWNIREAEFDIIVFLSAVHYEPDQHALFAFLRRKLTPRGVLIMECGIADELPVGPAERWVVAHRHDGFFRYPTYRHLTGSLLAAFATRYIGPSPPQPGDPITRHVLHCRPRRQELILLAGPSGAGKTELTRSLLGAPGVQIIYTDVVIQRLLTDPALASAPLATTLRLFFTWPANLEQVHRCILDRNLAEPFAALLLLTIDAAALTVVIDGAALDAPELRASITAQTDRWFKIWRLLHDAEPHRNP